jgi:hypothetical protein
MIKNLNKKYPYNSKIPYYNLLFFKRHSNIFLVLSKKDWTHVTTLTGGNCLLGKKKKKKKRQYIIY